jgi:hypothetical protein
MCSRPAGKGTRKHLAGKATDRLLTSLLLSKPDLACNAKRSTTVTCEINSWIYAILGNYLICHLVELFHAIDNLNKDY